MELAWRGRVVYSRRGMSDGLYRSGLVACLVLQAGVFGYAYAALRGIAETVARVAVAGFGGKS